MKRFLPVFLSLFLMISPMLQTARSGPGYGIQPEGRKSTVLFSEDFSQGVLPEGWQNNFISGMAFEFFSSGSLSLAYILSEQGFPDVKAQLQSPAVNLSEYNSVSLNLSQVFFMEGNHPSSEFAYIEVSTDQQEWMLVHTFEGSQDEPGVFSDYTYEIGHLVGGEPQVYIRLHFDVDEHMDEFYMVLWEIESITLTAQSSGVISEELLSEDFEGGELPSGWQNNFISGMAFEFFSSGSVSLAYILSEQGFPDVKAQLQSPAVNLSEYSSVSLNLSQVFFMEGYHPSSEFAYIEVSTNQQEWMLVHTFEGSQDEPGVFSDYTYEIGHLVGGEPQVYIRLHFDVDEHMDDFYMVLWEIESISLTAQSAGVISELPWTEDFEGGELPAGWAHEITGASGWTFQTVPQSHALIYGFPGMPDVQARLISPLFDLSGETQVSLTLNHHFMLYDESNATLSQIQYSEDGETWHSLSLSFDDTQGEIVSAQFDITAQTAGKQVRLGFYADYPSGIDTYEVVWEIFQLSLEGAGIPLYNVSFEVQDAQGDPIIDAQISLGDQLNDIGNYQFEDLMAGNYVYLVEKEGYHSVSGQISLIDEDVVQLVVMQQITYPVQFFVYDNNFFSLDDALVSLGNIENQAGDYHFNVPAGEYAYSVTRTDYQEVTGSLHILDGPVDQMIYMDPVDTYTSLLPLYEDFSGLSPDELPQGWNRSTPSWRINHTDQAGAEAPEISFRFENFFDATAGEARLLTPWIDPQEQEQLWLSFEHYLNDVLGAFSPYSLSIEGSWDEENWMVFWSQQPNQNIGPETLLLDISEMAGNLFRIAFVVDLEPGTSPVALNWYLDEILIEYEAAPEIYTLVLEVDMRTAPDFDPESDQVFVSGSMFSWAEPGAEPEAQLMSRVGTSWTWRKSLELEEGAYDYQFYINEGWQGAEFGDEINRSLTLVEDMTISSFWSFLETPPFVSLSLVAEPEGAGILSGSGVYYQQQSVQVEALPADNYSFLHWTMDAEVLSAEPVFTFIMPGEDVQLVAHFQFSMPDPGYVSDFPWFEDFESENFPPQGWNRLNQDGTDRQWTINTNQNHTPDGSQSAFHNYHMSDEQDGWLISPGLLIPEEGTYALSFWSYNSFPSYYESNSLLISTGSHDPGQGDYVEIWSPEEVESSWVETWIALDEYAGETIFLAFRYQGLDGHAWYLDDVKVAEYQQPVPVFNLTLLADPAGAGSLSGAGEYEAGTSVAISAEASEGYVFLHWRHDGELLSDEPEFTFTMPAEDVQLVAHFEPEPVPVFNLTLLADPTGAGSLSGAGEYEAGTSVAISAEASEGYVFLHWRHDGEPLSNEPEFTFTMPAEDVQLVAHFDLTESVTEVVMPQLSLFPNPSRDYFNLESPERSRILRVQVLDLSGRLLYEVQPGQSQVTIRHDLKNGLFMLVVETEQDRITKRIQVSR